ncbi:hypothetical protein [Rhodanobacter sp. MP7CTX1]|uniref:hypothetical protein n=1 Tax=Rhodanobacter sp. MP7CTX1 TaxID=2723084 RepID=UPI00160E1044|nr:hypothetical protein [Rhodanobacter sp. MP7CTX1]MBB6188702.1 hypothetical protein [Rhodanobacter sp. MP7CTX1]
MLRALLVGMILLGAFASPASAASPIPAASSVISADEHAIRDARKAYNSAPVSRDATGIAKYWQRDNSGSIWANGVLTIGRDNFVARYAKTFANRDFIWGFERQIESM